MRKRALLLLLMGLLFRWPLLAQKAAEASCKDAQTPAFRTFDRDFRAALEHKDAVALSFLASFPLRVNSARGTLLISDAASLAGHFDQVFTPALTKKILSTGSDFVCTGAEGVGYAAGSAWVSTSDTANPKKGHPVNELYAVNVDDPAPPLPRLVYVCRAAKHRVVVEELPNHHFRYRSWDILKALTDQPNVDLGNGTMEFNGHDVCAYPTYTFKNGNVSYAVDQGLGCTDGTEPKSATGSLTVAINGKTASSTMCF